jgi:hypothetical protein
MSATPITADQETRECTECPPYITRCAHFDGRHVALMNTRAYEKACDYWQGQTWAERGDWAVLVIADDAALVCSAMCRTVCGNRYGEIVHEGKQRDIAEAAFHAAEERLLRPV